MPERLAEILAILSVLLAYGRHLADTLEHRAVARGFASIAQFFGTAVVGTVLAHLSRGILRAVALQQMLLRRAARGRDLAMPAPRVPGRRKAPPPDEPAPDQAACSSPTAPLTADAAVKAEAAARQAAARRAEARITRRLAAGAPLTLATLPSQQQLDAEVRRSPIGLTLTLICRDLGVSPGLCLAPFWSRLFLAIRDYRGSPAQLVLEMRHREREFEKRELDRNPKLGWPEQTREGLRQVLGFFIGEKPVSPLPAVPAPAPTAMAGPVLAVAVAATGPP